MGIEEEEFEEEEEEEEREQDVEGGRRKPAEASKGKVAQGTPPPRTATALAASLNQFIAVHELVRLREPDASDYVLSISLRKWLKAAAYLAGGKSKDELVIVDPRVLVDSALIFQQFDDPKEFVAGKWQVPLPGLETESHSAVNQFGNWILDNVSEMTGAQNPIERIKSELEITDNVSQALVDPAVVTILARAERIKVELEDGSTPLPVVDATHAILAILLSDDGRRAVADYSESQRWNTQAWPDLTEGLRTLVQGSGGNPSVWSRIIDELQSLRFPPTAEQTTQILAGYDPDDVEAVLGDDSRPLRPDPLGAVEDARAIARIVCHEQAQPPLAIGLFAQWGGGKSTFMKLLRRAIDETSELAGRVGNRGSGDGQPALVRRVVHIEFNAWHYVDSNLWASLATHIFKQLYKISQQKKVNWLESTNVRNLSEELESVKQARQDRKDEQDRLETELEDLKQGRQSLISQRKTLERKTAELSLTDVAAEINIAALASDQKTGIDNAVAALGLATTVTNVSQLQKLWTETQGLSGILRTLFVSTTGHPVKYGVMIAVGIVVFSAVTLGGPRLLEWLSTMPNVASIAKWLLPVFNETKSTLGLLGGAAAWLLPHLSSIRKKVLEPLSTAVTQAEQKVEDRKFEIATEIADRETRIVELIAQEAAVDQKHTALARRQERLERMAQGEDPVALMTAFIEDRARSDRYSKHLGLISMIRQDFESMTNLLSEANKKDAPASAENLPKIDRIVLYIDDLDRCRDEQVVEVLEAVHLLLAFKLFVVVVGVDVRWLDGALRRHYGNELGGKGQAQPIDYLGKIFQIPFWLRELRQDSESYGRLVSSMLNTPAAIVNGGKSGTHLPPPDSTGLDAFADQPVVTELSPHRGPRDYSNNDPEVLRKLLELEPGEEILIGALNIVAGQSPRALKRFINVYRIIRARKSESELENWIGRGAGTALYPGALLALAIETGLPAEAAEFVERYLAETTINETDFKTLLNNMGLAGDVVTLTNLTTDNAHQDWFNKRYSGQNGKPSDPKQPVLVVLPEGLRRGAALLNQQLEALANSENENIKDVFGHLQWPDALRTAYASGDVRRFSFRRH